MAEHREALLIKQRSRALEKFNEWEKKQGFNQRTASEVIADIGFITNLIPAKFRANKQDPQYKGVQLMHEILSKLAKF